VSRTALGTSLFALLFAAAASPVGATFPGRNGKIAFLSDRGGSSQIYLMRPDGTHVSRIARTGEAAQPSWSPDGKALVFAELRGGALQGISVVAFPSRRVRRLTAHKTEIWDSSPRWSADGTRVVFQRQTAEGTGVYVMRRNGKGIHRLSASDGAYPTWSPDGHWIAFVAGPPGAQQLFKMRASGRGRIQLTHATGSALDPDWSPNGKRLTYVVVRDRNYDVYVIGANGREQRRLTTLDGQDLGPSWAPDGTSIVYVSQGATAGDPFDLYRMSPDGSHRRRLTSTVWSEGDPTWQRITARTR